MQDAERIYTLLRSAGRELSLPMEVNPNERKSLVWEIGNFPAFFLN